MKNKKLTYFLLVVVAGLWGLITYRVVDAMSADDETPPAMPAPIVKEIFNDFSLPKDTTKLLLNYRDPFGQVKSKDTVISRSKSTLSHKTLTIAAAAKPAMNWSFITYSGYIRNPTTKKLVALISINGQSMTLAEGESKNQVKLLKNLRDSIRISYEGKTKVIPIKSAQ
ncbi:MAG TPA: hypothetical protein VL442_08895 [Mucilaginibacter sp.]|nr:hypothetical protein [Mucilaginibacter sp.]